MRLKSEGKISRSCPWFFVNYIYNKNTEFRLGLTVPNYCGNAVIRNKLKRWSREFFRLDEWLIGFDINVVFRKMPKDFYKLLKKDEFDSSFEKCVRKIKRN